MDCLGLPGETPIRGPPPKVSPVRPVPDPEEELPLGAFGSVLPGAGEEPPLGAFGSVLPDPLEGLVELLVVPEVPLGLPAVPVVSVGQSYPPVGAPVVEPGDPEDELLLLGELAVVEELLSPFPMHPGMPPIGTPKKPSVGVLFWPKRMIFHSSLPVVGSMYFLRSKGVWLVLDQKSGVEGRRRD